MFVFIIYPDAQSMTSFMPRWSLRCGMLLTDLKVKHWTFGKLNALCVVGGEMQGAVQLELQHSCAIWLWKWGLRNKFLLSWYSYMEIFLFFSLYFLFVIWYFQRKSISQNDKSCWRKISPSNCWRKCFIFRKKLHKAFYLFTYLNLASKLNSRWVWEEA